MPARAARRFTLTAPRVDVASVPLDPTGPPDELVAVCDARGRPLAEGRPRGQVHRDGVWHRSFHCWVVRAAPREPALVLQRRSPTKQTWPGAWDVSAAGHFRPDEGLTGGLREIAEELGLTVAASELVALKRHREVLRYPTGLRDREYQEVYLVRRDEPLSAYRPDPREVTGLVVLPARGIVALARGALPRLVGRGWLLGAGGWSEQPVRLTRATLVPRAGRYYERVARAADRLLVGPGGGSASTSSARGE
jgi:isopentenyldiphosphate isomerase